MPIVFKSNSCKSVLQKRKRNFEVLRRKALHYERSIRDKKERLSASMLSPDVVSWCASPCAPVGTHVHELYLAA